MRRLFRIAAFLALAVAAASAPGSEGVPEAVLKQYRLALTEKMVQVRRYPKAALDRKVQGTSIVQLTVGSNGRIRSARVDPSSGSELLDTAALEMVMAAHPLVALPDGLRGRSFTVAVPVHFKTE